MEALALHTGASIKHWEDNTSCISVVEDKIVTPAVKHIDIFIFFLQEKFYNVLFIQKYEKSSVIPADMCTKPCLVPIISSSNKCITGFRLYLISEIEHYQFMILHEFIVK